MLSPRIRRAPTVNPQDIERLMAILCQHQGARNAITSGTLAARLHIAERSVREIIARQIDKGALIGASVEGVRGGYYMITNLAELEATRNVLRARAVKIFERDAALQRAWRNIHGVDLQPLLPTMGRPA